MATILVTGGTGMIGGELVKALTGRNHQVIILTRASDSKPTKPGVTYASWDIEKQTIDMGAIAKANHIIHLAGANVAEKRWTEKRKKEIVESRVKSGELLAKALRENKNQVESLISASAIGWYGADTEESRRNGFKEEAPPATDFLGRTCKLWEESVHPVTKLGIRLVKIRTGIVLSRKGGALEEFRKPLRFGVATVLGDGKQVVSWIHIDDIVNIYVNAVENKDWSGPYNAVAPHPVTNKELVTELAKARDKGHITIPVPSFLLKVVLGEMSIEVLKSATVSANKLPYTFKFPRIGEALKDLEGKE